MNNFIFKNIPHALRVSFFLEGLPVSTKSPTRILIEDLMKNSGRVFQDEYKSSINWGGLNPFDIRAQCAMVRAMVQDHLTKPEKYAIWARYGTVVECGNVFTLNNGASGMYTYLDPLLLIKGDALKYLISNFYMMRGHPSMRDIGIHFDIDLNKIAREKKKIASHAERLENMGCAKLNELNEASKNQLARNSVY